MKALTIGLLMLGIIGAGGSGLCATNEAPAESTPAGVEGLIQQGPALLAQGEFKDVLSSIEVLPVEERNDTRVRCLECFANLSAWSNTNAVRYKMRWQGLRRKLIYRAGSEVTPLLVVLLEDKDPFVREYAAELLGYIGDTRALDALHRARKTDDNRGVRKYAKWAHKQIARGRTPATADLPPLAAPRMEIPVAMDEVGPIATDKSITIVNGTEDFQITRLGFFVFRGTYRNCYADLESWADIIVEQLETELRKRGVQVITPGGPDAHTVVIGVLSAESGQTADKEKKDLMEKMSQIPLVRLVDINAQTTRADLQKDDYTKAGAFKKKHRLDMLLHIGRVAKRYDFSLIDLKANTTRTTSFVTERGFAGDLTTEQLSDQVLTNQCLIRVLRTKKKDAAMAQVQAASAGDHTFSVWVQQALAAEGSVTCRCTGSVLVREHGGEWSKTYTFVNEGASTLRAIDGATYQVVKAILKDPAFRRALSR